MIALLEVRQVIEENKKLLKKLFEQLQNFEIASNFRC